MFTIRRWHFASLLIVGALVLIMNMYVAASAVQYGEPVSTVPFLSALPFGVFADAAFISLMSWLPFVFTSQRLEGYEDLGYFLSAVFAIVGAFFFLILVPTDVMGVRSILTFGSTYPEGGLDVNIGAALQALMLAFFWRAALAIPNAVLMIRSIAQGRSGQLMRSVFGTEEPKGIQRD